MDLVIVDMVMGYDFDGLDTLEALKELFPEQRVLIASGYTGESRAKAAQELGADWLAKPYEMHELATAVRKQLSRP